MRQAAARTVRANQDLPSALQEAEEQYTAANGKSRALYTAAAAHLPGGNTRTTVYFSPFPLYMAKGEGSRLTDVDGHVYADFINEYTAGVFGHSHPLIARTLAQTLAEGINLGASTEHEIKLSGEVRRRFPAMELLRFCNSGTEANLLALATARAATGKDAVMVFNGAYHGSMFYFSHGASPLNMPFPVVTSTFNDSERMASDIAAHASRLAAVIIEPMQGGAGALPADGEFLKVLRAETERHGILMVFDEVMTSRVHHCGLQAKHAIRPDLVTLGKYIGGGITIGAFGGQAEVMKRFDPARPDAFPHGGTFNNNVLAMAAGHVGLTQLLTEAETNRMNALGERLRTGLSRLADKHGVPMVATGVGSIFGIHFHEGPLRNIDDLDRGEEGRAKEVADLKKLFHLDMMAAGYHVSRRIMGNLSLETSESEADGFVMAVEEFLINRKRVIADVFAR